MRKWITLFSTISLLSSSVSTVVACGVGDGDKVTVNFGNEPAKKTSSTDPLRDYVYSDDYKYETNALYKPLATFMQLAVDKVKIDRNALESSSDIAKHFYSSDAYKSGHYESINYNADKKIKKPFSFLDTGGSPLVFLLTDNDISKQVFAYWYITYNNASEAENPQANDKTSILLPKIEDFIKNGKEKSIIKTGWIHLFLTMKDAKMHKIFKIDFNIEINVGFKLVTDKNKKEIVIVDTSSTIDKPLGDVDFHHPENTFRTRIKNMKFSESVL